MKNEKRDQRRNEIMDIAVTMVAEHGYRDASMLKVAKAAKASKETLYAWFGDKRGLFEAIIRRNASAVQAVLAGHLEGTAPVDTVLIEFGSALLELLMSEDAVAINRAAISELRSDPSLAQTLVQAGRGATLPSFIAYLELQKKQGTLVFESSKQEAENFLGLLIGDMKVRRLLGALTTPTKAEIEQRATHAAKTFIRINQPTK